MQFCNHSYVLSQTVMRKTYKLCTKPELMGQIYLILSLMPNSDKQIILLSNEHTSHKGFVLNGLSYISKLQNES